MMRDGDLNLDAFSHDALVVIAVLAGMVMAVVVLPWLVRAAVRLAPPVAREAVRLCPWLVWRPFDPVVAAWRAIRRRINPVAEERRDLARYLRSIPPHSGLTAYEEMQREIDALPPGEARAAMRQYFKKVAPPSRRAINKARRLKGRPRVRPDIIWALEAGRAPACWGYAGRQIAARKGVRV